MYFGESPKIKLKNLLEVGIDFSSKSRNWDNSSLCLKCLALIDALP